MWLGAEAGTGGADVSGNSDYAPTEPELEVYAMLHSQLTTALQQIRSLEESDVAALNRSLASQNVLRIVPVPSPGGARQ